jgi:uncharacterized SAM-binding protein YcdF (DUF218 family)
MIVNRDTRRCMIDYLAPATDIFRCEYALFFGSRHAQAHMAAAAKELFERKYFAKIIVCGGKTRDLETPEALEIADRLLGIGIPAATIITECTSLNTGENVSFARAIIGDHVKELFLLGKIYAKRRYAMTIRARWPTIERISCYGVNYFRVDRERWWESRELRAYVFDELRKIPRYIEQGYIREITVKARHIQLS